MKLFKRLVSSYVLCRIALGAPESKTLHSKRMPSPSNDQVAYSSGAPSHSNPGDNLNSQQPTTLDGGIKITVQQSPQAQGGVPPHVNPQTGYSNPTPAGLQTQNTQQSPLPLSRSDYRAPYNTTVSGPFGLLDGSTNHSLIMDNHTATPVNFSDAGGTSGSGFNANQNPLGNAQMSAPAGFVPATSKMIPSFQGYGLPALNNAGSDPTAYSSSGTRPYSLTSPALPYSSTQVSGVGLNNRQNNFPMMGNSGGPNNMSIFSAPSNGTSDSTPDASTFGSLVALNNTAPAVASSNLNSNLPIVPSLSSSGVMANGPTSTALTTNLAPGPLVANSANPPSMSNLNSTSVTNFPMFCDVEPINPTVWHRRHISEFLLNYPAGTTKTVDDFSLENGIFNWNCKIGEPCDAGQICGPIPGPIWHVFVSLQNWMNLQSAIILGVTFASNILQTVASGLAIDLHNPDMKKYKKLFKIEDILTLAVGISAVICAAVMWVAPGGQGLALGLTMGASAILATAQASVTLAAQNALKNIKSDAFTRWADYSVIIGTWEQNTHQIVTNQTHLILNSGISTEGGLYGAFKDGNYFLDVQPSSTAEIEQVITQVATARIISNILISKKAFVTVGSDECNNDGPNGAFKMEDGWLSYCDKKGGRMMNIVAVRENDHDKTENHLYNAASIPTKYNISVEYIVKQSVQCQEKYGGWSYDPYQNSSLPLNINADCIANLPVCYCRDWKGVRKYRRRHTTVEACRKKGHLPI